MNLAVIAAIAAIALAVYLIVTDWVSLAPWNKVEDVPIRQKLLLSATNYTPLVFIAFAVVQESRILLAIALFVGAVDLLLHIAYWWLPYLRGTTDDQRAEPASLFGGTTTFLPPIVDHPIPNAQHVVVGVLMLLMVVATAGAAVGAFSRAG
jgi:hypothetical protein